MDFTDPIAINRSAFHVTSFYFQLGKENAWEIDFVRRPANTFEMLTVAQ